MSVREGLEFETEIASDTAPLNGLVEAMFAASKNIHVLRDPTRGGVTSALSEIAEAAKVGMLLDQARIPIGEDVKGACEILGLDFGICGLVSQRLVKESSAHGRANHSRH